MTAEDPDGRSVDRAALLGTSLAAVVALTFGGGCAVRHAMVAVPIQSLLVVASPVGRMCADVGAAAGAAEAARVDLAPSVVHSVAVSVTEVASGECLGAATDGWLWLPASAFAAIFSAVMALAGRRRDRCHGRRR